jgi:hypothetical protein
MTSYSWKSGNGLWTTATDWTPTGVPGSSDSATINTNSIAIVTTDSNVSVGSLTISGNGIPEVDVGSNTTFSAATGQIESFGIDVNVDDGGEFELGENGNAVDISDFGIISVNANTEDTEFEIAGNLELNGTGIVNLGTSGSAPAIIAGDGVGSPGLTLAGGQSIVTDGLADIALPVDITANTFVDDTSGVLALTAGTSTTVNAGSLQVGDGTLSIDSPVNDSGGELFAGYGGKAIIAAAVTNTSGGSTQVTLFGTLDMASGGSMTGGATFTASGNILEFDIGTSQLSGSISGIGVGDIVDFAFLPFAGGDRAVWQTTGGPNVGMLSVVNGAGSTLATLGLHGQFTSANFAVVTDANGGTAVEVINPSVATGTTADMIMANGQNYEIYDIGGNAILSAYALELPPSSAQAWEDLGFGAAVQAVGLGGFHGSDTSDMMVRNTGGALAVYDVSDNNITGAGFLGQVGTAWQVAGYGDFSSNVGETDMLMRNSNTGAFEVYDISNNAITFASGMGQVGLEWSVAGFGDFSGKANETDMLMRNSSTGAFEVYDISNNTITFATGMGQVGLEWSVAGFGDFSGNANETDMLMRNTNTGQFEVYDISGNAITFATAMGQVGLAWQVAGFGDLSSNANETDMLMRNSSSGAFEFYDITGNQITNAGSMGQVGLAWTVSGIAADPPGGAQGASNQMVQSMASFAPAGSANTGTSADQSPMQSPGPGSIAELSVAQTA